MERKKIKPNKTQLNYDLIESIWLTEDNPRSSSVKSVFEDLFG